MRNAIKYKILAIVVFGAGLSSFAMEGSPSPRASANGGEVDLFDAAVVHIEELLKTRFDFYSNMDDDPLMSLLHSRARGQNKYMRSSRSLVWSRKAKPILERIKNTRNVQTAYLFLKEVVRMIDEVTDEYFTGEALDEQLARIQTLSQSDALRKEFLEGVERIGALRARTVELMARLGELANTNEMNFLPKFVQANRALTEAVMSGDLSAAERLLSEEKINPNFILKTGNGKFTLLGMLLCRKKLNLEMITLLLLHKADPNFGCLGKSNLLQMCLWRMLKKDPDPDLINVFNLLLTYEANPSLNSHGILALDPGAAPGADSFLEDILNRRGPATDIPHILFEANQLMDDAARGRVHAAADRMEAPQQPAIVENNNNLQEEALALSLIVGGVAAVITVCVHSYSYFM